MARLHLVDGTFELFRAHYSPRPSHTAPDGTDKKATLGVVQSLITLLDDADEQVTHLAVAFDNPIESFRNQLFAGYKTGAGIDPALHSQFDAVEEAVAALGVTVWSMKEFEADDALATAAVKFKNHFSQVRILTPDKDLGQVLSGDTVVQVDRMRKKLITEASQLTDKGLRPEQVSDFLALVGDTADGIPGVDGWGEKGTAAVLKVHAHLEDIPRDASQWKAQPRGFQKLCDHLNSHRDEAMLFRTLARLRIDVPLTETAEDLRFKGTDSARFSDWSKRIGKPELVERIRPR